tara:strand:- start:4837 stop:5592 length:756 start_codon:yes stop_codon:yes gene_type:complete
MKLLIICAGDRSKYFIAHNCLKYIHKTKDHLTVCVLDKNKKIISFLKKKGIKFISKDFNKFFNNIKKNEYDWLLNIWGYKILKKNFLKKFKNNLNLHPAFLPFNRGRDPYYFSIMNNTPIGICIHKMDETIDGGRFFLRKEFNFKFPVNAGKVFDTSLKEIRDMFISNWTKLRNNEIKLKKFTPKISQINKRKELVKNNFIDLDDKNFKREKLFVLNCLAQNFDFLKLQVKIFNKVYDCDLKLIKNKKKNW